MKDKFGKGRYSSEDFPEDLLETAEAGAKPSDEEFEAGPHIVPDAKHYILSAEQMQGLSREYHQARSAQQAFLADEPDDNGERLTELERALRSFSTLGQSASGQRTACSLSDTGAAKSGVKAPRAVKVTLSGIDESNPVLPDSEIGRPEAAKIASVPENPEQEAVTEAASLTTSESLEETEAFAPVSPRRINSELTLTPERRAERDLGLSRDKGLNVHRVQNERIVDEAAREGTFEEKSIDQDDKRYFFANRQLTAEDDFVVTFNKNEESKVYTETAAEAEAKRDDPQSVWRKPEVAGADNEDADNAESLAGQEIYSGSNEDASYAVLDRGADLTYDLAEAYAKDESRVQTVLPAREDIYVSGDKSNVLLEILDWLKYILIAVIVGLLISNYVLQRSAVVGRSMYPTLENKDQLLVEKLSTYMGQPDYGAIVTLDGSKLEHDTMEEMLVKRVIARAGDQIDFKDGRVILNGQILDEPYVAAGARTLPQNNFQGPYTVPEGHIYVLGDNRENSADSRVFGAVPDEAVAGKVLVRIYPFDRIGKP